MRKGSDCLRLTLEARHSVRVFRKNIGQDLKSDVPPEALITRTVDYPHFSAAEQCYDRIRTNLGTRRQRSLITHRPHTYLGRTRLLTLD